jgi:lipopolysaccharide/colanic/teichoic acid biosynthesis glycosyltransferase
VSIDEIDRAPASAGTPPPARRRAAKRLFDVVAASICLLFLAPLLVAAAVAVRLTTPGPVLFRQTRVGRNRRPFTMYKFRTMQDRCSDDIHRAYVTKLLLEDQPPTGGDSGLYKIENDPRVTTVGRVLRKTSIDELPQLLNVVRGEMSLVGPRPALPWEAELFSASHQQRFTVPPGLTGLWQVSGRNHLGMKQGLDLDLEYLKRQSFWFDLGILLRTVPAVLFAVGSR